LLGFLAVTVLRKTGTNQAINEAKEVTRLAGEGIVAPAVTPGVISGDPAALHRLDRIVRQRVLSNPVVRVKLWDATGRVLYSDAPPLIGLRFDLGREELEALRRGGTDAEVSDLSRPENRFENGHGKLLEVYHGIRTPDGDRLLFESYQYYSAILASGERQWRAFLPALIGALILLELVQIPLAMSRARRLRRGQDEREGLLRRAVEASDLERRRIARDLHDGPVQDLAGVGMSLAAAAGRLRAAGDVEGAERLEVAGSRARQTLRGLRSLLVELYPPSLRQAGLPAALDDLVAPLRAAGVEARVDIAPDLRLPEGAEKLLFRVAQEGVRNVLAHAEARTATVTADRVDGQARLSVADDGRGFDPAAANGRAAGHFGLNMLADLADDAGGRLDVRSQPGAGTTLEVEVPA
ncbi:MAG TPA: sensor histidine kinase, partial [Solirubrobacteraceae bacterium]